MCVSVGHLQWCAFVNSEKCLCLRTTRASSVRPAHAWCLPSLSHTHTHTHTNTLGTFASRTELAMLQFPYSLYHTCCFFFDQEVLHPVKRGIMHGDGAEYTLISRHLNYSDLLLSHACNQHHIFTAGLMV